MKTSKIPEEYFLIYGKKRQGLSDEFLRIAKKMGEKDS